jgi:hypothetical protein
MQGWLGERDGLLMLLVLLPCSQQQAGVLLLHITLLWLLWRLYKA